MFKKFLNLSLEIPYSVISRYTIAYISRATDKLSETDILKLLEKSDSYNNGLGIKGILLFNEGSFLQVLEGDEKIVKNLFNKIAKDDRHDTLIKLFDQKINEMIFRDYNSKFNVLATKFDWITLNEYLKRQRRTGFTSEVLDMLEPFLEARKFQYT